MNTQNRIYFAVANAVPRSYLHVLRKQLVYSGETVQAEQWAGSVLVLAFLFSLAAFAAPVVITRTVNLYAFISALAMFSFVVFAALLIIYFKAEDRRKRVDNSLPDLLQLVAANLRAGMTPFQALKLSARKEFGPLKEEVERATAQAMGTGSFASAILSISQRVNSEMLERTLKLFTTAMRSGGRLADLLEEMANDIAATHELKKELVTNTKTYTMFIMFTVAVGTPMLLAIAIHFLNVVTELQAQTSANTAAFGLSFLAGEITITAPFLTTISIFLITITGTLASALLGVISEGKMRSGFRYVPFLLGISFIIFFVGQQLVSNYLKGIS